MQGLWLTNDPIDRSALDDVHHQLAHGPLGRQVIRNHVPGAGARWVRSTATLPVVYSAVTDGLTWADRQGSGLDPSRGPGWRLSACTLPDGRSLISMVSSHVLADARGLIHAVDIALRGASRAPDFTSTSDWAAARETWRTVLREFRPTRQPASSKVRTARRQGSPVTAIVSFDADEFDHWAVESLATPNSLFVHTVASILFASGYPRQPIEVSLPIDTRPPGVEVVGNALAMGAATLDPTDTPADTRARCGDGFGRRLAAPEGIPQEFLHLLPDRLAYRASKGAGELDLLCSNIGTLPDSMDRVGSSRAQAIAARAIHPGITTLPRTRLSGYVCRLGGAYTLSLVSLDPERIRSRADLESIARECLPVPSSPW